MTWTVTFSEIVTGLTAANFSMYVTGPTGATVTSVTGSGTTWTVTASLGTSTGSIALQLAKSQADVQAIFKVNRIHFDRLKTETPTIYDDILDRFKKVKSKFQEE